MRKVSRVGEKQFSYEDISGEQIITDQSLKIWLLLWLICVGGMISTS